MGRALANLAGPALSYHNRAVIYRKSGAAVTYYDVYIGNLEDDSGAFSFEGGDWSGNSPPVIVPLFPPATGYGEPFFTLKERIHSRRYEGRQTDWGCWVAKVFKSEIRDFIHEVYRIPPESAAPRYLKELLAIVETLDDTKVYGLVARES